jgi:hypothetical protein
MRDRTLLLVATLAITASQARSDVFGKSPRNGTYAYGKGK